MVDFIFNQAKGKLGDGTIDWDAAGTSIKVLLLADGSTVPDKDADSLTGIGTEASGGTYVRKTLATKSVTVDDTNDRAAYDADDVTWTALSFTNGSVVGKTKAAVVFFDPTGSSADSACVPLVFLDFVVQSNGGDVTLQFSTSPSAVFTIT